MLANGRLNLDIGSKTCPIIDELRDMGRGIGKGDLPLVAGCAAVISVDASLFGGSLRSKSGSISRNMFAKVGVLSVSAKAI